MVIVAFLYQGELLSERRDSVFIAAFVPALFEDHRTRT